MTPVFVYWTPNAAGQTGGSSQPAVLAWPEGAPLPEVGDWVSAPGARTPLQGGAVEVVSRTWQWNWSGTAVVALRLDCEWVA